MLRDIIICFGDSLTWGSRDTPIEGRGYPAVLQELMRAHTGRPCICVNKGVTRETSVEIARRAYDTFRSYPESMLALVLAGTNDCKAMVDLIQYAENMRFIVTCARVCNKRVLVGTLPAIDTMGMWIFPRSANWSVRMCNDTLIELSSEMDFPLVYFSGMERYLVDGVHFGHEGYVEMANRWFVAIKDAL